MRVHVAQKQKERLIIGFVNFREPVELGERDVVEIFGFVRASVGPARAPAVEVQVFLVASAADVALEPDARSIIAAFAENFREGFDSGRKVALMPERDCIRAENIKARHHRTITGRRRDGRREAIVKNYAVRQIFGDIRGGVAFIAVERHVIAPQ